MRAPSCWRGIVYLGGVNRTGPLAVLATYAAAGATWLGDVFGLDVLGIARDAAEVRLSGCAITFVRGPADRITAVVLTGRGAPGGSVAGLHYLS